LAKIKKVFICSNCGYSTPKWLGQCPSCQSWNTLHEEILQKGNAREERQRQLTSSNRPLGGASPVAVQNIEAGNLQRQITADPELNRVLGGGIVPGSLILVGGQPGIGKSTLMLQVALQLSEKVLYVSGEESSEQIKMRADRIGLRNDQCFILPETNTDRILKYAQELEPGLVVIDSIQTLSSSLIESMPGSVSQVRECAGELQRFAKASHVPVVIIGHINKDGAIAGPKLLEHIVDAVLQFEGDRNYTYRILRTLKNRFGSTHELGIYEMQADGLRPVENPSELLLSQKDEELSGSAVAATMEGLRPVLIETQALVSKAVYGNPQRSATGFDLRRLGMLLAVLEKRCGFPLAQFDVFLNLAGGIRLDDPAMDLSILSAILSSFQDIYVPSDICFAAEVGLSGEIRAVSRIDQRIQEADRLGFQQIFISKYNLKGLDLDRYQIRIRSIGRIEELYEALFV